MIITLTGGQKMVGDLDEQEGTLEELAALCSEYIIGEKDGAALIPARFHDCPAEGCKGKGWNCGGGRPHRLSINVYEMSGLGVDLDDIADAVFARILEQLDARGICYYCWHTHSHVAGSGLTRARLLFPFAVPLPLSNPRQWSAVAWPALVQWLGLPLGTDFSCRNPDRIYYLPRHDEGVAGHCAGFQAGALLDWRPIVGDAVAAAAQVHAEPVVVLEEDPERAVDLSVVRAGLERINDPYLKRVLKEKAPTPPPDERQPGELPRREAWKRVTVHVANVAEGWESRRALLELLLPAFRDEVESSPDDHTEWSVIEELLEGAMVSAPGYKAEKKARERAWHELRRARLRSLIAPVMAASTDSAGYAPGGGDLQNDHLGAEAHEDTEEEGDHLADAAAAPSEVKPPPREYLLNDGGNADRFVDQHKHRVRYVPAWNTWLCWDGKRWKRDNELVTDRLCRETAMSVYAEAIRCEADPERFTRLDKWAHASNNRQRLDAMVHVARPALVVPSEALDADPWLLNCSNGTIDLRTGKLRAPQQSDLITLLSPVEFDPDATCPTWEAFLAKSLPSEEMRAWVQKAIGYTLTGDVTEHVLFFLYGLGSNGKSTLLTTLQHIMGEYAKQGAPELLLSAEHEPHPTAQADLQGSRLVVCSETEQGRAFAEAAVKQLTGDDIIKARFMRQDFFQFRPTHKIYLAANHKPRVRGTDHAIWRRIRLLPFNTTIPDAEKDPQLPEKLRAEAPGILAWAVRGCLIWQRERLGLTPEIAAATQEYRGAEDTLASFIDDVLVRDAQGFVTSKDIYRNYESWCHDHGEKVWSGRALSNALIEHGFKTGKRKQERGFEGIRLRALSTRIAQATANGTVEAQA